MTFGGKDEGIGRSGNMGAEAPLLASISISLSRDDVEVVALGARP